MSPAFPGMTFRDAFCEQVLQRSQHEPVQWLSLPPGHSLNTAVESLLDKSREGFFNPLRELTLRFAAADSVATELLEELDEELMLSGANMHSLEDFILENTDQLRTPYSFLLPIPQHATEAMVESLLKACGTLAEFSKDLEGPLSFLLLSEHPLSPVLENYQAWVWEPLLPQPSFLQFSRPTLSLESSGFQIYLAYRCYWEAAGRPDFLERLQEDVSGLDLSSRQDADERLDALFDELLQVEPEQAESYGSLFHECFRREEAQNVLKTGLVGQLSSETMARLESAGVAWYPPGSLHAYLTPQAANAFAHSDLFRRSWNLRQEHLFQLRQQVRQNTLLASWIVGLTALIEREMLQFCRQAPRLTDVLENSRFSRELCEQRDRMPTEMMYGGQQDLIEYATFGQLQSLIFGGKLGQQFTLSQNRVNQVRHVRNLVTHLHSVRWPAVRIILKALSALQTLSS